MNIVLYTTGFISLLCAIVVLLLSLVGRSAPRPEPELLVVDDPLLGEGAPAFEEEPAVQEARA